MKTLTQHIYENNFHKSEIKDNKSSLISLDEKLVVNKNFKVNGNDEFYETFKESIGTFMECHYFTYHRHFKDIKNIPLTSKLSSEINDAFDKAKRPSGEVMHCIAGSEMSIKIYNNMIEYIDEHQNELEMMYNVKYLGGDFVVNVIETSEILCAIVGPKRATPTSSYGNIIVTFK